MAAPKSLTPKQQRFVEEYLVDACATQAAIRAGYSAKTANEQGSRLLANVKVKAAVQEAMEARSERTQVDADWVLKRLHDEAEADLADIYYESGEIKPVNEWPAIWRQGLVAGVESSSTQIGDEAVVTTRVDKIKVSDRIRRIELIGKHVHVNAFVERKEVTGKDGGPVQVNLNYIPIGKK